MGYLKWRNGKSVGEKGRSTFCEYISRLLQGAVYNGPELSISADV